MEQSEVETVRFEPMGCACAYTAEGCQVHVLMAKHQEFLGCCGTLETTGPSKDNHFCSIAMLEMGPGHFGGRNKKIHAFTI